MANEATRRVRLDRGHVAVDAIVVALLISATVAVGARGIGVGGLGWSDAPQHFMNGAFVLAAARERPLDDLRGWAEQFYLRHPALGLIVYWPPGFALVEAICFALAGESITVARGCVIGMAAGAVAMLYLLAARLLDRRTAALAALLLLLSPHGRLWLTDVMIEWPATFWLLACVRLYVAHRDHGRFVTAALAAAAYVMAVMTKQTAGFMGPVLLAHAAFDPLGRKRLRQVGTLAAGLGALAIVGCYFVLARRVTALPGQLLQLDLDDPLYYFTKLGEIVGWPTVALAVAGVVGLLRERGRFGAAEPGGPMPGLLALWFAAWAGFSTLIAAKEPRYFFFALPPLVIWAASCASIVVARFSLGAVLVSWVAGLSAVAAWRDPPVRLPRYDAAVASLVARGDADLVLVDAVRDGQFVVDAWLNPAARERLIPLRASKLLYARAARERYGYEAFVHEPRDVLALLDRYGVRYVLMESALPVTHYIEADPPPRRLLREVVADAERFEWLETWPLRCGDPAWDAVELRLYRYRHAPPRTSDAVTLPIPGMGRKITIPLPR